MPVAPVLAKFTDDKAVDERFPRLHEDIGNTIVADHRIGQRKKLTAVRGICQTFLIADHARIEDDLAHRLDVI